MSQNPVSRKSNVVESELEKELLIYDLVINKAFCLNQTSALAYRSADGTKTAAEISRAMSVKLKTRISEDLVWLALGELKKENLLENGDQLINPFADLTRREAIRRVGLASMVMLPVISSLIAPKAAMAASACAANGAACIFSNNTQSNCCNLNQRCFTTNANPASCTNCYTTATPLASCQSAGCCNQRSDKNLCCSGTYNESTTNNVDYICRCAA
jgi:hypothetical protein